MGLPAARGQLYSLAVKCFGLIGLTSVAGQVTQVNEAVLADVVEAAHFLGVGTNCHFAGQAVKCPCKYFVNIV